MNLSDLIYNRMGLAHAFNTLTEFHNLAGSPFIRLNDQQFTWLYFYFTMQTYLFRKFTISPLSYLSVKLNEN